MAIRSTALVLHSILQFLVDFRNNVNRCSLDFISLMKLVVKTKLEAHYTRRKKHSETVWLDDFRYLQSSDVVSNQICLLFLLPSHRASRSSRTSREFRVRLALRANAALLPRLS